MLKNWICKVHLAGVHVLPPEYLDDLFAAFLPGKMLIQEIRDFYGLTFKLERHDTLDGGSSYAIDVDPKTLQIRQAVIRLNTATDRLLEAVTHELLHLRQPIRGFPIIQSLTLTSTHEALLDHVHRLVRQTINIVDHDIFVKDFVDIGLPLSRFLVKRREIPRYYEEARNYRGKNLITEFSWAAWSWWSFEFLNNCVAIGHGDDQAPLLAQTAAKAGERALPGFNRTADQIRAWVTEGKHRHKETYGGSMQELMKLMHLPAIDSLVFLPPSSKSFMEGPEAIDWGGRLDLAR